MHTSKCPKIVIVVVEWVSGNMCNGSAHSTLILDCRQLMRRIPSTKIKHCYREVNQCVDRLGKMEQINNMILFSQKKKEHDFTVLANPPRDIILLMYYDFMGLYYERLSLSSSI